MAVGSNRVALGNLPGRLTSLVGRDAELAELKHLVARERLVTLIGPAGVGKTSLAIAVAAELTHGHKDGAWFCDLSVISDPAAVPHAVAAALGIAEHAYRSVAESIRGSVRNKQMLIVLDNCEHIADVCARLVADVLAASAGLRIIATSRETLEVPGEIVWTVQPLVLPDTRSTHPRVIARSPAVRLFVERAAQARPGFELNAENAATIVAICQRLDGIPLALELCAARVRAVPPDEILFRLKDRFGFLTARSRVVPRRQRTVRASIDWSYELLDDAERALFRRLSVFAGSFDVDAVEVVCPGGPLSGELLSTLAALIDKSLISTKPAVAGRGRYRLLETMREYADERLRENREWELIRGKHARHFAATAEEAVPQLELPEQVSWLERLSADHDNFRAALEWAQLAEPELLPRLAAALQDYWQTRGHYTEGRSWLTAALEVERAPTRLRARLLRGVGNAAWRKGDFDIARRSLEEAVVIERRFGEKVPLATALGDLGFVLFGTDDFRAAGPLFDEELAIARETGDRQLLGGALFYSGILALQLDRVSEAHDYCQEGRGILRELGHTNGLAYTSQMLGMALIRQHDFSEASLAINEALQLQARLGDRPGLAGALNVAAELAAAQGRLERAMVLEGSANAKFSSAGVHTPSLHQASRDRWLPMARRRLGVRATALLEKGARLSDEQAIAFVLSDADSPAAARTEDSIEPLSEREREVASLLATGLTNREIAAKLRVSERTIDAHSEHIRNKLGVRSRAQIAAWITSRNQ